MGVDLPAEILDSVKEKKKGDKKRRKEAEADEIEENKESKKRKCEAVAEDAKDSDAWWADKNISIKGVEGLIPAKTFQEAGFPKRLVKACEARFKAPTPVQAATWPLLMDGRDVIGIAKTGSGKTLCFTLPFLAMSKLGTFETRKQPSLQPRMVVLAPTRELVQQIASVVEEFVNAAKMSEHHPVQVVIGGVSKYDQCQRIRESGADIVCATTGRMCDLSESSPPALDLSGVQLLVLDEADRMLDMGFIDHVKQIASLCPADRQTVFFSATWPRSVNRLAKSLTRADVTATIAIGSERREGDAAEGIANEDGNMLNANRSIEQIVEVLQDPRGKLQRLVELLKQHRKKKILVFALYKKEVATLEWTLQERGFPDALGLQGDMSQHARNQVMEAFRSGENRLLIATDVASRGLDVPDIDLVLNYTFPLTIEDYIHRIGRTARGTRSGLAITLFNGGPPAHGSVQDEKSHAADLKRVLQEARQVVPKELEKLASSTGGNKATKKKSSSNIW